MFGRSNFFDNDPFFNDPFFSSPFTHNNNDPFTSMHTHMNNMMEQHNRMFNSIIQQQQQQQQQFIQPQMQHQRYNNNVQPQQYLPSRSNVQIEEIPNDSTVQQNNNNTRVHVEEVDADSDSTVDNNSIAVHHTNTDKYGNTHTRITGQPQYYSESYSSYTVQQSNNNQPPVVKQQSRHTTNMNGVHETKSAMYDSSRDYRAAGIQRGIHDRSIAAVQQQYGTNQPQRSISYNGINEDERQQFTQQWNTARQQQHRISDSSQRTTVPPPLPAAPVPQYIPTTRTATQAQLPGRGSSTGETQQQRRHIDSIQYDPNRYNPRNNTTQPFTGQSYKLKDSH